MSENAIEREQEQVLLAECLYGVVLFSYELESLCGYAHWLLSKGVCAPCSERVNHFVGAIGG